MQRKSKFAKQYSTTPGFKSKLENCCTLMSARSISQRPPGARFFLQQRRKNRGRKTPPKAGGGRPQASGPSICIANAFLIERERGSKTAPFTLSLPGARLGCVRHRRRPLSRLPDRFVPASVPCHPVSKPLAAPLALTSCGGGLGVARSWVCDVGT